MLNLILTDPMYARLASARYPLRRRVLIHRDRVLVHEPDASPPRAVSGHRAARFLADRSGPPLQKGAPHVS